MFSGNKFQNIAYTLACHTDLALLMHITASAYKTDHVCHVLLQLHCSLPQHNSLSMHINMHSIPNTTHAPHCLNPPITHN